MLIGHPPHYAHMKVFGCLVVTPIFDPILALICPIFLGVFMSSLDEKGLNSLSLIQLCL